MVNKKVYHSLVISTGPTGESDLLVVLLTRECGKIRCIAKGAKKSKKRFMNALEPFAYIHAVARNGARSELFFLESATLKSGFEAIRQDYKRFMAASLCLELVDLWCRQEQQEPEIFHLLLWYLRCLDSGKDMLLSTLIFQARLLDAAGHMPPFDECTKCGSRTSGRHLGYNPVTGQVFCQGCTTGGGEYFMGMAAIRSLEFWVSQPLDKVFRLKVNSLVMAETWKYLKSVHSSILEKSPKSYRFLDPLLV